MDIDHSSIRAPKDFRFILPSDHIVNLPCFVHRDHIEFNSVPQPLLVEESQVLSLILLSLLRLAAGHNDKLTCSFDWNLVLITVVPPHLIAEHTVLGLHGVGVVVEASVQDSAVSP